MYLPWDKASHVNRGFAFVTYKDPRVAKAARKRVSGVVLRGRRLLCRPCLPKGVKSRSFRGYESDRNMAMHGDQSLGGSEARELGSPFQYQPRYCSTNFSDSYAYIGDYYGPYYAPDPPPLQHGPLYVHIPSVQPPVFYTPAEYPAHYLHAKRDSGYSGYKTVSPVTPPQKQYQVPPSFFQPAEDDVPAPPSEQSSLARKERIHLRGCVDFRPESPNPKTSLFVPALNCRETELPAEPTSVYWPPQDCWAARGRTLEVKNIPPMPGHRALESEIQKLFKRYDV
jgi:hypothetical protein